MSKESTLNLFRRLEQLNGIGAALSRERDIERLLENILEAAKTITGADGGTLYSVTEDQSALKFEILRTDSLGIRLGGTTGKAVDLPLLPLRTPDGAPNDSLIAAHAAIHDRTVNIADAYCAKGFDFSGTRAFDERTPTGCSSPSWSGCSNRSSTSSTWPLMKSRPTPAGIASACLPSR